MDERPLYNRLLADVHAAFDRRKDCPTLTLFQPCIGHDYNGELMVIGRAVNGWIDEFNVASCGTDDGREALLGDSESNENCPMGWVVDHWGKTDGYNTKGSSFWRVIQQVSEAVGIDGARWSSQLAWTNLYKVSPYDGGNPSEKLCDAQFTACGRLLAGEFDAYRPKRALVITGLNWFNEFVNDTAREEGVDLGFDLLDSPDGSPVQAVGRINGTLVVVTERPERKPEGPFVEAVNRCFRPGEGLLSKAQQASFEEVSGSPWDGFSGSGGFMTSCPGGDRAWDRSPWNFAFKLLEGDLYMELAHRMTNNRTCGFDRGGRELPNEAVEAVLPSDFRIDGG